MNAQLDVKRNLIEQQELRSEELQEILTRPPMWLTRWGAGLFTSIVVLVIILSWFIKSPDKIGGTFILTTENPPIKLLARRSGKIQKLFAEDNKTLKEGDLIAEIENPLGIESVHLLEQILNNIQGQLSGTALYNMPEDVPFTFGDSQNDYNALVKSYLDYKALITNRFYKERVKELKAQILWQSELVKINESQLRIFESQLNNAKLKFSIDEKLHQEKVSSDVEHIQQQEIWLSKLMEADNYRKNLIQGQITVGELKTQLRQIEFDFEEKQRDYKQSIERSIKTLRNYVKQWQQSYTINATSDGLLTYLKPWRKNQFVKIEEEMFAIVQDRAEYVVYVTVNSTGAGKIKIGQRVKLKLDNYPYEQYGSLDGIVKSISLLPNVDGEKTGSNNTYLVTTTLTNNLTTDYKTKIKFKPNLGGQAEIVTHELRLLERVFYNLRKIVAR